MGFFAVSSGWKSKTNLHSKRGFNARLTHNRLYPVRFPAPTPFPVPGILAVKRTGAIMDKSDLRLGCRG